VRTVPRSRHNPQFNKASLPRSLKKIGLKYVHTPGLGGLRHAKRDSPNLGWQNASFRGLLPPMCRTVQATGRFHRNPPKTDEWNRGAYFFDSSAQRYNGLSHFPGARSVPKRLGTPIFAQ